MGYNTSKSSVIRNKAQLERIMKEKRTLLFGHSDPDRLAYKLREALAAAQYHEEYFHIYEALAPFVTFRRHPEGVLAVYEDWGKVHLIGKSPEDQPKQPLILNDILELAEVIGALIQHAHEEEILFKELPLPDSQLKSLYAFSSDQGWRIVKKGDDLLLSKNDSHIPNEWTP